MKQPVFLSLCLGCAFGAAAQAPEGLIGINTTTPQGILHIAAPQPSNDVVIDTAGRMGLGIFPSTVKLDLKTSATTPEAIRIQDGSQGERKLLTSDEYGAGAWAPMASGSWVAALYDGDTLAISTAHTVRPRVNYDESVISDPSQGSLNRAAGTITLPETGRYRVTLSVYWIADQTTDASGRYTTLALLNVNRGGTVVAQHTFPYWGGVLNRSVMPTFLSILDLEQGDVLSLATDETATTSANSAQGFLFMVELLL
jgi:hypothetical protein